MAKVIKTKSEIGKLGFTYCANEDPDTGTNRYFARLRPFSHLDAASINAWAAKFMCVSEASMKAAFSALADAIEYFVLNGHSVTLDGLGCFTFSTRTGIWNEQTGKWTSAGKNNVADVSSDDIRAVYVRFRPCTRLRNELGASRLFYLDNTFGYQLVNQDVKPQSNNEPNP